MRRNGKREEASIISEPHIAAVEAEAPTESADTDIQIVETSHIAEVEIGTAIENEKMVTVDTPRQDITGAGAPEVRVGETKTSVLQDRRSAIRKLHTFLGGRRRFSNYDTQLKTSLSLSASSLLHSLLNLMLCKHLTMSPLELQHSATLDCTH